MRCHICNSDSNTISFDRTTKSFSPCSDCQAAIFDCVISYPTVENDDILDEAFDVGC